MKQNTMTWGDLFCGGGGATTGAIGVPGVKVLWALNHSPSAIATHQANHPETKHYQTDILMQDEHDLEPVDGIWMSSECFVAGTLVLTTRGHVPIEEIVIGDVVLTHKNRWKPVTNTMQKESKTVVVKGGGNPGIETTPNHPFWVIKQTQKWNNENRLYERVYSSPEWVTVNNIVDKGIYRWATPSGVPKLCVPKIGILDEYHNKMRTMNINNPDLWWIIGRWVADGTVNNGIISISCGRNKVAEIDRRIKSIQTDEGKYRSDNDEMKWFTRKLRTADVYYTAFKGFSEWLTTNFGKCAHGKMLPSWIYGMDKSCREEFFNGYISGDGYSDGRRISATTVSKKLAIGIKQLSETLGYSSSLTYGKRAETCTIEGRIVNQRPSWIVSMSVNKSRRTAIDHLNHTWTLIREIKKTGEIKTVYNISVQDDESYVADGIVVHNCTNHSIAKGGKLLDQGSRTLPMQLIRFVNHCKPKIIIVENVKEFVSWGPLIDGRPDKKRKGESFKEWVEAVQACGYPNYEHRLINSADLGAYTSRLRYFGIFTAPGIPIAFPEKTHDKKGENGLPRWKACKEKLDLNNWGKSIFEKNLCDNTIKRIEAGLKKYGGDPFILSFYGSNGKPHDCSLKEPLPTITTKDRHVLCQTLMKYGYTGNDPGQAIDDLNNPLSTLITTERHAILTQVAPEKEEVLQFLCSQYSDPNPEHMSHPIDSPVPTLTTSHAHMLITQFISKHYNSDKHPETQVQGIEEPAGTVTCTNKLGLVTQFLTQHNNSNGNPGANIQNIEDPLSTLTTRAKHALITQLFGDIYFRFITVEEAKVLQGFPDEYKLIGTKAEQIRHIGNSVVPLVAQKIIEVNYNAE